MEYELFKEILSTGANASTIIVMYLLWRIDKRVTNLEWERDYEKAKK